MLLIVTNDHSLGRRECQIRGLNPYSRDTCIVTRVEQMHGLRWQPGDEVALRYNPTRPNGEYAEMIDFLYVLGTCRPGAQAGGRHVPQPLGADAGCSGVRRRPLVGQSGLDLMPELRYDLPQVDSREEDPVAESTSPISGAAVLTPERDPRRRNMRLVYQDDEGWVVVFDGQPVAIKGTTYFADRESAVAEISKRGMLVEDDGSIVKAPDPADPLEALEEALESTPLAVAPEVTEAESEVQVELEPEATPDDVVDELESLSAEPAPQAEDKPVDPAPRKRGRPAQFTPEEAKARRREQNRRYYRERQEARKREVAERSRQWWSEHPDKVREYRQKANEKRRERYVSDPEYRAKVAAANRAYQERRRAERAAAQDKSQED